MKKLDIKNKSYDEQNHIYGRIWGFTAVVVLSIYPLLSALIFNAWPDFTSILACFGTIAVFWLAGIVEVFTYVPMLGAVSGGYLGFVTGNLSNLKVPCALSCMEGAGVKSGTPEGEVVAIISTAVSSITTVIIIAVGVCLMIPFSEQLSNPTLDPAFANVLPALFGSLGVVFISKNWKIALPPIALMIILFVAISPFFNLNSYASVLIPVSALFTVLIARAMYKKGIIGGKAPENEEEIEVAEAVDTTVADAIADEDALTADTAEDADNDAVAELAEGVSEIAVDDAVPPTEQLDEAIKAEFADDNSVPNDKEKPDDGE